MAQLMQQLGCINALNLDGGHSSTLYLQGEVVNLPKSDGSQAIMPRIHNGVGVFLGTLFHSQ
jgi:exopolysaccharide biosynthesis protein